MNAELRIQNSKPQVPDLRPSRDADLSQDTYHAIRNLRTWAAGLPLIAELNRRGVPVIVIKSLPQVEDLYGHAGGRQSVDLDLVVPGLRIGEAVVALADHGWQPRETFHFARLAHDSGRNAGWWKRPWHFRHEDHICEIDLHSDAMDRHYKPALDAGMWERAVEVSQEGVRFFVLGPEDRLLLLCWQFIAEGLPWRKLADIERILVRGRLDWRYISDRADRTGVTLAVHLACDLAAAHSPVPVDSEWRRHVPIRAPLRHYLLTRRLGHVAGEIGQRWSTLLTLIAHDRVAVMFQLGRATLAPTRAEVADYFLGSWPTWWEYVCFLACTYAKLFKRPGHGRRQRARACVGANDQPE